MPEPQAIVDLVAQWAAEAAAEQVDAPARELAAMLRDPGGLPFAVGFIDHVIRPEDPLVAAQALRRLARHPPGFLSPATRAAVRAGGLTSRLAPSVTTRLAGHALRARVSRLVLDARNQRLGPAIERLTADGSRLNLNLLGEAVLGAGEAGRRLERTLTLLERDDVDYVSIKVSATVAPHSPWAFDQTVETVCERLAPLLATGKFVNLDMEEYRDLDLTLKVFTSLLDQPELQHASAGIVLQAYLPDAYGAMVMLQDWAATRIAHGGAPIKVRVVKGANLPMERVDSQIHTWPLATWSSKLETDAAYKRILRYALDADRVRAVRLGIAGHNLFEIAHAWLLAVERGVTDAVEFEMLLGMGAADAKAVARTVGPIRLYTPVVHPAEFDVALAYLVRRLDEMAAEANFLSAASDLHSRPQLLARERQRWVQSMAQVEGEGVAPTSSHRADERHQLSGDVPHVPDTDPAVAANRLWASAILDRIPESRLGATSAEAARVTSVDELEASIDRAHDGGLAWGAVAPETRKELLLAAADQLERRRAELIEVMASECGKTFDQADPEVSEAVDFARYYARSAPKLGTIDGAEAVPIPLTLVAPPWNFPVSIPTGCTLGALAAGSAVLLKPAPQAVRCAAIVADALWTAGIPRSALHLVCVDEDALGQRLVSDRRIGRVLLTGAFETAQLFRSWRPDLPLLAETSGKNAIIVTPSADIELAVRDLVASAFGNAGQKCSAASLAILVGQVADSKRFLRQLVDATSSLVVNWPAEPAAQVGPLVGAPTGKLERALTALDEGESWLVKPQRLDESNRLWSPGIRTGVQPGSWFHQTECFGPVLGLITAANLESAVAIQNAVPFGLTAGLHSLDRAEIAIWLDSVEAGNVYVNRGITGAIVSRQPFGGWKRSAVGPGLKAGGPSYLLGLCNWRSAPSRSDSPLGPVAERALAAARAAGLGDGEHSRLERALRSDAAAIAGLYGQTHDEAGLGVEINALRHLPVRERMQIRSDGTDAETLWRLIRVVAGAAAIGAQVTISLAEAPIEPLSIWLAERGFPTEVQSPERWLLGLGESRLDRIRYLAADGGRAPLEVWEAIGKRIDITVFDAPVTESGRLELLPFLREQAVSVTAHRFGTPDPTVAGLI